MILEIAIAISLLNLNQSFERPPTTTTRVRPIYRLVDISADIFGRYRYIGIGQQDIGIGHIGIGIGIGIG